jgi:outer membrane protein assembly factor BamB
MLTQPRRIVSGSLVAVFASMAVAAEPEWPSFRGPQASGVADGQNLPQEWNAETGSNIRWKTPIPGLAHSSPVIAGKHLFVTSAVGSQADPVLRVGLYGESPDNPEDFEHEYRVYCLDAKSGKVLWDKLAHRGKPAIQRHIKATHANCTPATDGTHVVAFFGSEGLYCYDLEGNLKWEKDLGLLDSGAFDHPDIRWGFGSSPIIHDGMVIVQCDVNNQSFAAAYKVEDGVEIWRQERESQPSWATPTVYGSGDDAQLILNGSPFACSYKARSGEPIWKMGGQSFITTPTPIVSHDLVFLASGYRPIQPIYAVKLSATGDITLGEDQRTNDHVVWSRLREGPYMPTPIAYGEHLYVGNDRGLLACYAIKTSDKVYRERLAAGSAFTASPVASDGKIYFTSEDGNILVVKAGEKFELLATNPMGEVCMATPAIAHNTLYVRTQHHVVAIGK